MISRLQASAISCSSFSACVNSRGLPTATARVVGEFDLVELLFDGLAQFEIVDVAQDEDRLDDLAESFDSAIELMLAGIGIEPAEDVGSGCFLGLDGLTKRRKSSQFSE
ncbi:MAG: hypothetical protein R3D03_04840 [Geminicoccaceae bacterium]